MSGVINVERLTSANFQTHNVVVVVVVTALSTLCIAVFSLLLLLLQNSLCLRDFRVFVNFYVCVCAHNLYVCTRRRSVCVRGVSTEGGAVVKRTSV